MQGSYLRFLWQTPTMDISLLAHGYFSVDIFPFAHLLCLGLHACLVPLDEPGGLS